MKFVGRLIVVGIAALVLVSCGPSETSQREAFIGFLQNDVLAKKGTRVPALTSEMRQNFGDYAAQYDIITQFHETMNAAVAKPMQEVMARATPGSIEEIVKRRGDIEAVRSGMAKMRDALEQATAAAGQARAALKQPNDLAPVYARAYDKLVTQPSAAFRDIFPVSDDATASVLALADLIDRNRSAIMLNGSMVEVSDPKLRASLQSLMDAMNAKRQSINAAIDKVRRVMNGG